MYLDKLRIRNYKCIESLDVNFNIPDGYTEGSGLNIFVGENNTGKSTLFESIFAVRNKVKGEIQRSSPNEQVEYTIELDFTGDIPSAIDNFVQENKKVSFKNCIYKEGEIDKLTVKRDFKDQEEFKKILFKNGNTFSNISGIDAAFQAFFQISNIWADTNPENEAKYGASTVCGNLLSDISEKFKLDHKEQYNELLTVFNKVFNNPTSGLQGELNKIAKETEQILNSQFGEARLKFRFEDPEMDLLFKSIKILVNDGEETEISEKGHGMQRAVILSLLQVYAKRITEIPSDNGSIKQKPHFLFIDEPEMGLHPQAQKKLFDALKTISTTHQVFINTHSENFISADLINNIFRLHKNSDGQININDGKKISIDFKENRKFFLHHHKLFFTNKVVFVEGVDDFELYPIYLKSTGLDKLALSIYFLAGCGDFTIFKPLLDHFKIKSAFIFDLDIISTSSSILKNFDKEIYKKILKLGKQVTKKNPENLLDINLTSEEKTMKYEIIEDLKKHNFFILPNGALEQYLTPEGRSVSEDSTKELYSLFQQVNLV